MQQYIPLLIVVGGLVVAAIGICISDYINDRRN